jgi:signal peptidase I
MTYKTYELDPTFRRVLVKVRAVRSLDEDDPSSPGRWTVWGINMLLVVTVISVLLLGYGLIDNRWYRIAAVQGGSMSPTLMNGDAIVLTRPPAELEVGMIVTLEIDGHVVTHRVVSVAADGTFTTMGDANSVADDWSDLDVDVIGIQRARIPLLGRFLTSIAGIRGSSAWLIDRSSVAGSIGSADCFDACSTMTQVPDESTTVVDESETEEAGTQVVDSNHGDGAEPPSEGEGSTA